VRDAKSPETSLKQNNTNRRRRGRPGRGRNNGQGRKPNHEQAAHERSGLGLFDNTEDAATFWARSNARLGIELTDDQSSGRRAKGPIDFPCAVCGIFVSSDRWPKERHDVRCDDCRQAMNTLFDDADRDISDEMKRTRAAEAKGKYDGLPDLTEEDREAVAEMRALAERRGNGRRGNNSRRGSGGQRKRRHGGGGGGGGRNKQRGGGGGGGGGRRRRRSGGGGGGGGGGRGGNPPSSKN
jgi:hypothetical protein